jgi:hypothetical protein
MKGAAMGTEGWSLAGEANVVPETASVHDSCLFLTFIVHPQQVLSQGHVHQFMSRAPVSF